MVSVSLSERLLKVIDEIEPKGTREDKVVRLVEAELRRRLARYQLTDNQFQAKYGMALDEFENQGLVAQKGYGFDVESDYQDWDLAIDGIRSTERQLAELLGGE